MVTEQDLKTFNLISPLSSKFEFLKAVSFEVFTLLIEMGDGHYNSIGYVVHGPKKIEYAKALLSSSLQNISI